MDRSQTLAEIRSFLQADGAIPARHLLEWMDSDDLEVLGAVITLLRDSPHRIQGALKQDRMVQRVLHYHRRCLLENPQEECAHNRYQAGVSLRYFFFQFSADEQISGRALAAIKTMLAELYRSGDSELRACIATSCLEHLFESRRIAAYFSDWQEDPILAAAYTEALEWGRNFWPGQHGY